MRDLQLSRIPSLPGGKNGEVMPSNFALIGAAGYIAPRHLTAIRDTGNRLVAAVDPHDSVGILDSSFPDCKFFTEIERFDRFLEKQRRNPNGTPVQYVSICSPNYLHDAHARLALRLKAHAVCEKPLAINPWNLDQLAELEHEHGRRVYAVLQLRLHRAIKQLRETLNAESHRIRHDVDLTYITRRGAWYHASWKGSEDKSGGLAMNIGVHLFDLLLWLFGSVQRNRVQLRQPDRMAGVLELDKARVRWFLSVNADDLPPAVRQCGGHAYRSIAVDGEEIEFSSGFTDLHTEVYRQILAGNGLGIQEARSAIELVHAIRERCVVRPNGVKHFCLEQTGNISHVQ